MKTINDSKEGDILYGFDLDTRELQLYYVYKVDEGRLLYSVLVGTEENDFDGYCSAYIMFPDDFNLEKAILCNYCECWWIYTTNFDEIEKYINCEDIKSKFPVWLDMWTQKVLRI